MFLVAASVAMVATARAQSYITGDLVIGFTGGTASDVLFDLGAGTSLPTSGSLNLSSFLSSSLLQNNGYLTLDGKSVGVIGARPIPGGTTGNQGIWSTTIHSGPAPSTLGNSSAFNAARLSVDATGGFIDGNGSPINSAVVDKNDPNSWNINVKSGGANTFISNYGDPNVPFSGSSTILDLWYERWQDNPQGPALLGTLTLGSDYSLTFTAVPEPSTYGLVAGFGLLMFGIRRQMKLRRA
jgi:hypothetical protein